MSRVIIEYVTWWVGALGNLVNVVIMWICVYVHWWILLMIVNIWTRL